MPDVLSDLCRRRWRTALNTSSSYDTELSMGNVSRATDILLSVERTLRYSSTLSSFICSMVTCDGGGVNLLYHSALILFFIYYCLDGRKRMA